MVNTSTQNQALITALLNPALYDHPVLNIQLIETHISWVILTGPYAYKIKKPVNLGFLDFSTLEKRKYYCEEELRLNRRLAPEIYLISDLPSEMKWSDVLTTGIISFSLTVLATIYPAWRASRVQPAEALRYE